jgi:beta-glucosidase
MSKRIFIVYLLCLISIVGISQKNVVNKKPQPFLGYKTVQLLKLEGFQFKDLNQNGKLDKYEDWRLSNDLRAKDLLTKMSVEDKVGFMLISTSRLKSERSAQINAETDNTIKPSSDLNEEDQVSTTNIFNRKPLAVPMMSSVGATKGITKFHLRHFIFRANVSARVTAEWTNKLQALAESDGLGIPVIIASNPRNHITKDASIGLSVGATTFSNWPGELGLSAMRDLKLVR